MAQRTVVVGSRVGLHARPAKLFSQAAAASGLPVTIAKGDGAAVNAASILQIMALGVQHGQEVTVAVDDAAGDHAQQVVDELAGLLERDLDAAGTA